MKYLFIICFCLGLYRFSSHSLRMKVTQTIDCSTYNDRKTCASNLICEWKTICIRAPLSGTMNTVSSTSTTSTTTKMQSASTIK